MTVTVPEPLRTVLQQLVQPLCYRQAPLDRGSNLDNLFAQCNLYREKLIAFLDQEVKKIDPSLTALPVAASLFGAPQKGVFALDVAICPSHFVLQVISAPRPDICLYRLTTSSGTGIPISLRRMA